MNFKLPIALVALLLACCYAQAQNFEKSYAIVIGVDNYPNSSFKPLDATRADADAMEAYFRKENYHVKKFTGAQATRDNIRSYLLDELAQIINEPDRFVFYFSGHGTTTQKDGYIIPYDGRDSAPSSWIAMSELQGIAKQLGDARHQLFIFDSCFGGSFAVKGMPSPWSPDTPKYIQRISEASARQFMTAGGANEQVPATPKEGNSVFTHYLLKALDGQADTTVDGYITASEISAYIQTAASNSYSTPVAGNFPGHANGDFIFNSPIEPRSITRESNDTSGPTKSTLSVLKEIKDQRGKTYPIVQIANLEWMQSNLDYPVANSWCYNDSEGYCADYGRLYDWESAQLACSTIGSGWRLPTDREWRALAEQYGGIKTAQQTGASTRQSQIELSPGGASNLDLQYGGGRYGDGQGNYQFINAHGKYWSSTANNDVTAWYVALVGELKRYPDPKNYGYSVRCVRNI